MLRVTIELVPFGNEEKKEVLDVMTITNTGNHKNSPYYGHYKVQVEKGEGCFKKAGVVLDHYRKGYLWGLIQKSLRSLKA